LYGAEAGDDAVCVGPLRQRLSHAVAAEHVELLEAALVKEVLDPLARRHLAPVVLALDGAGRARLAGLVLARRQLLDALVHGMVRHTGNGTGDTLWSADRAAAVALGLPARPHDAGRRGRGRRRPRRHRRRPAAGDAAR